MAYPMWPEGLAKFERSGWQLQPQDARRRRQSDAGPPGFRRRFSSVAKKVGLTLVVSRSNLARFWRFYEEDCANGSGLFRMPDPATDGWPLLTHDGVPLLTEKGQPLLIAAHWLCAWGDEPPVESVNVQTQFKVTFSVWVMP